MQPDPIRQEAEKRSSESAAEWLAADAVRLEYERRPEVERRRIIDERFEKLEKGMADLKKEVAENTQITKQIRDLITSFTVFSKIARGLGVAGKWLAGLATAGLAVYAAWHARR